MVQVYNKMSDYNDKELWSLPVNTVYQTPRKVYQNVITGMRLEVSRKIRKSILAQHPFKEAAS
jgi:hypothetical protein